MTLIILYPFSIRYVCKLDSCTHILWAFGLALKPGVTLPELHNGKVVLYEVFYIYHTINFGNGN
jgi:hypothetical protein